MKRFISLPVAAIGLAVSLAACHREPTSLSPSADSNAKTSTDSVLTVAVTHPVREDLSRSLTLTAEFKPYQEIDVHSKVTGYVREMKVDVGDHVKTGDVLAVLEIPEIEEDLQKADAAVLTAQQEEQSAEAAFSETDLLMSRLQSASKEAPGLIAQQDLDTDAAKNRARAADLQAAKQKVAEAQADAKRERTMLAYSTITAPFDSVVTRRYADTGALIQAGTSSGGQNIAVVALAELKKLRLEFPMPESAAASIHVGDEVEVEVAALHAKFTVRISRFAQKVDAATRTMLTEADIDNPDFRFLPGMYASARVTLADKRNTLAIPIQCVSSGDKNSVFVLNDNHKIEQREITLGLETPTMAEVLEGLSATDQVVVGSHGAIAPGETAVAKEMTAQNL